MNHSGGQQNVIATRSVAEDAFEIPHNIKTLAPLSTPTPPPAGENYQTTEPPSHQQMPTLEDRARMSLLIPSPLATA